MKYYLIIIPIIILLLLFINIIIPINKSYSDKLSPYECGMNPLGDSRNKFKIQYYLIAILFIVFDLEILFLFPFAIVLFDLSLLGFWFFIIFIFILSLGLIFEISKQALDYI